MTGRHVLHYVALALRDERLLIVLTTRDEVEAQERYDELNIQTILFQPITVDGETYRATEIEHIHRFSAEAVGVARCRSVCCADPPSSTAIAMTWKRTRSREQA